MSVRFHRKKKINKGGHINISKSGLSHSQKVGKFTFNSRGSISYNSSIKGLSFRTNIISGIIFILFYWITKLFIYVILKLPYRIIVFLMKQPIYLIKYLINKNKVEKDDYIQRDNK